ncbi:MAG: acyltransferase [Bacteroidota bacterium]
MQYTKQFDSVRAIAVIMVIVHHWGPENGMLQRFTNQSLGPMGVDIFFVLSGFLITNILLAEKTKAESGGLSKGMLVRKFYLRRVLRIFPIYYLTIFGLLAIQPHFGFDIKPAFGYLATYTVNYYFIYTGDFGNLVNHLWSLSVEEQFYLVWPWMIVWFNKKYMGITIAACIVLGISSQYLLSGMPLFNLHTITCLDALGMGALLAWVRHYYPSQLPVFAKWIAVISILVVGIFVFESLTENWDIVPLRTIVSIATVCLLTFILEHQHATKNLLIRFLNSPVLIFIGKISYGIYLYHNIIPAIFNPLINKYLHLNITNFLLIDCSLLLVISWLSYRFIEKPFIALKKRL